MSKIWTLEARDSMLLEVFEAVLNPSPPAMRAVIQSEHQRLAALLTTGGVDYTKLRNALVPRIDRIEGAFLFDTAMIKRGWYGGYVAAQMVPLLPTDGTQSYLGGDLIVPKSVEQEFLAALQTQLPAGALENVHFSNMIYGVYANNLSASVAKQIDAGLKSADGYLGFVPLQDHSPVKTAFSMTMSPYYVRLGKTYIGPSESEDSEIGQDNLHGWPLDENGLKCVSVPPELFDLFLSYKIERPSHPGEHDTRFALAAISDEPKDLGEFTVLVEEGKLEYLLTVKAGQMARAGIEQMSTDELQDLILTKIASNYIYELEYKPEWDKSFFDIVLEFVGPSGKPVRLKAFMEYSAADSVLRLGTMY